MLRVLVLAVVAMLASGCSPDRNEPGTGQAGPEGRTQAQDDLGQAVSRMAAEDALAFEMIQLPDEGMHFGSSRLKVYGTETLSGDGWSAAIRVEANHDQHTIWAISDGSSSWMTMDNWPEGRDGCWLDLGTDGVPLGLQALHARATGYVALVTQLRARRYAEDGSGTLLAAAPLVAVTDLLTVQILDMMSGTTGVRPGRPLVPVTVQLDDGWIARIDVRLPDILKAIDGTKVEVSPEVREILRSPVTITVSYPEVPELALRDTPDPSTVFTSDEENCLE